MSEKIYACLLRLFPSRFRDSYGEDALQLFRDRLRDETGIMPRLRLWRDLLMDLALSLPAQYVSAQPAFVGTASVRIVGAPFFFVLEQEKIRLRRLLSGCALSLAVLFTTGSLLDYSRTLYPRNRAAIPTAMAGVNGHRKFPHTGGANRFAQGTGEQGSVAQAPETYSTSEELFPPPIDYMSLTNAGAKPQLQPPSTSITVPSAGSSPATAVAACGAAAPLDPERQRVLDAVIANVNQHYFDQEVARQMTDTLTERRRCGDYALPANEKTFAALLTRQLRDVSHDMHLEVIYSPESLPQPPPQESPQDSARRAEAVRKENCFFKKVELLPHNIGYVKFDAFLEPSACGSTAEAAMASVNNASAVIFDLRDNHGGTAEMVSLISSYLFDHPEYMFDPRRVPTPQSWTSSPVPGSKLTNKPVFILTSATTISAAEQFTYDLKMLKRATIVGENTAGGAHAGIFCRIDDHFAVAVPEVRSVNPYGAADWESTGIAPDVAVPAASALETAEKLAVLRVAGR
jgi:hypothetical protein